MFPICGWTNKDGQPLIIGFAGKARSGKDTAGFFSRWILWSEPTVKASLAKMVKRFF